MLPYPEEEWRYYFEPSLRLAGDVDTAALAADRDMADVQVDIHQKIRTLLDKGQWALARRIAREMSELFASDGYQPDGLRVKAGDSWARRFVPRERG